MSGSDGAGTPGQPHGKLDKKLYVVISEPVEAPGDRQAVRARHLAYQCELEAKGILFAGGPLLDAKDQPSGTGLIIYRAPSLQAAREIAENDPYHRHGMRKYTIRPWRIAEGSLGLKIKYSTGACELE